MTEPEFKRSDIVRTVLGGPAMYVLSATPIIDKPDSVAVFWFTTTHDTRTDSFPADMLRLAPRPGT